MRDCSWIFGQRDKFENIRPDNFKCSSDRTVDTNYKYNCIAWAAGKNDKWWWPSKLAGYYWPEGLPREAPNRETIENFLRAYETEGFERCDDGRFEDGFEKIAIYVGANDVPKHAARLLPNGAWTSKLGDCEDIEHETLQVLEGKQYGKAKAFLRRQNPIFKKPNELKKLSSRLLAFLRMR